MPPGHPFEARFVFYIFHLFATLIIHPRMTKPYSLSFIVGSAILTLLFFAGCKKEDTKTDSTIPVLAATKAVTVITQTSATSGGNVTSDGGLPVTSRGVCYGKNSNPIIDIDSKTENGTGSGEFGSSLTGLEAGTKYFVRAYATNSKGTGYGSEVSFTTSNVVVTVPVLDPTTAATNITASSATSGGSITSDGNGTITARGVCWDTIPNPTISGSKTSDGTGTGSFTSDLSGLMESTTYYVRSYATNTAGTGYGAQTSFTTSALTVTDVVGNVYQTVKIGGQTWMKENLKTSKYRNGNPITTGLSDNAWQNTTTGAYAICNNDAANNTTYGKLYNWYAVTDSRNLCPAGWHVPSEAEWTTLENFLGDATVAGGKMKTTTDWTLPNTAATNESGFSGLPGGYRASIGIYGDVGAKGCWWSSTEASSFDAWYRALDYYNGNSSRISYAKQNGFSVRCLRD